MAAQPHTQLPELADLDHEFFIEGYNFQHDPNPELHIVGLTLIGITKENYIFQVTTPHSKVPNLQEKTQVGVQISSIQTIMNAGKLFFVDPREQVNQAPCEECKGTGWYEGFLERSRCSQGCPETLSA